MGSELRGAEASLRWRIEPLDARHEKDAFQCGKASLDEYLRRYALQNQRKNIGRTFVAVRPGQARVEGYYTLASGSVAFGNVPEGVRKGLPRYPIPVGHLGRLAVAGEVQRQGLGAMLLVDALRRIQRISQDLAICGVEVNALDDGAKAFYLKYGFVELLDDHRHLYLPMSVVHAL